MNTRFPKHSPRHEAPMYASFTAFVVLFVTLFANCPIIAAASGEVPFKGSLEGEVTSSPLAPPLEFVLIEGTGDATGLGQFTVEIPHVVNFATSTAIGSFEFTAANGDTVTATFTGQASLTETPGILSIVETATITGGTGRFASATGSLTVERLFNAVTNVTSGSFEGKISSPGAKHASLRPAGFQTH